jgi:hypothetical protein
MQQGIGKGMVTKVARNNPTQVQPAWFSTETLETQLEKRQPFQQMVLGKLDIHM